MWLGVMVMITVPELAADALGTFLASYMQRRYSSADTRLVELVPSIARIALECIGNSDALYHNVESPSQATTSYAAGRCMPICHRRIMRT
jgi:hypothetical protein